MGIAIAEPPFLLETDKQSYLQFQPVYLKLSSSNSKNNDMQVRPLEFGDFVLKMEFPDGTRSIYRPMIQACSFSGAPRTKGVEYSTLILNGAELVSSKIGMYTLILTDRSGYIVSWPISYRVEEPVMPEDKQAKQLIETDPIGYGMFIYMEGGDHLVQGHAIVKNLSESRSSYSSFARAVLAINYSHDALNSENGSILRRKNPGLVENLYDGDQSNEVPEYLKLKGCHAVFSHLNSDEVSSNLQTRINEVRNRNKNNMTPFFFDNVRQD